MINTRKLPVIVLKDAENIIKLLWPSIMLNYLKKNSENETVAYHISCKLSFLKECKQIVNDETTDPSKNRQYRMAFKHFFQNNWTEDF